MNQSSRKGAWRFNGSQESLLQTLHRKPPILSLNFLTSGFKLISQSDWTAALAVK